MKLIEKTFCRAEVANQEVMIHNIYEGLKEFLFSHNGSYTNDSVSYKEWQTLQGIPLGDWLQVWK